MNYLRRIKHIKDYRVFRNFKWSSDLNAFSKVNVIYGWNGSGKTTFSNLLANIEHRTPIDGTGVTFEFEQPGDVKGRDLGTADLPSIRVFNRDFVKRAIDSIDDGTGVGHIISAVTI